MIGTTNGREGRLSEEYRERYRDGKSIRLGPYYKYQRWEDGRNVSRRVSSAEVEQLRKAVDGYHRFEELADEFAQMTIEMTRKTAAQDSAKKSAHRDVGAAGGDRGLC